MWKRRSGTRSAPSRRSDLLMNHMARHLREENDDAAADRLEQKAKETKERANMIRELVLGHETVSNDKLQAGLLKDQFI